MSKFMFIFMCICIFIIFAIFLYVGFKYVQEGLKKQRKKNPLFKKQEWAKKNAYIKDAPGSSLDNREIYVLTPEELGITNGL